jgi:hypothetical protein
METKGIDLAAIPQTAIRILTSPSAFFREMPKTGGYVEPLVFMVAMAVVGGLIHSVLSFVGMGGFTSMAMSMAYVVIMPVSAAIFGFIGAAIMYVIWKAMGSRENYETAYRCGAYISATMPITALLRLFPYLGSIAGIAITTFFIVIASVIVHGIDSKKAWTVFGAIGAILALLSLSGEFASRKLAGSAARFGRDMEKSSELMKKQSEEMRKLMDRKKPE